MSDAAHLLLIRALGGNERTGMCRCPAHDDVEPSLCVSAGSKVPVVLHCFSGCTFERVSDALRRKDLWPVPGSVTAARAAPQRSAEERRRFSLRILASTRANHGQRLAPVFLAQYFASRGIKLVPDTAMAAVWSHYEVQGLWLPNQLAMIFPVSDGRRILGAHVTWFEDDSGDYSPGGGGCLRAQFEQTFNWVPQRQCYGPIKGGYVKLYRGQHDPTRPLMIAEGIETACAAVQLAIPPLRGGEMLLDKPTGDLGAQRQQHAAHRTTSRV